MVSLIETSTFNFLKPIFIFLFSYALMYAILTKTKILGDHKGIISIISMVVAIFVVSSSDYDLITSIFPPFILVLLLFVFFLLLGSFLGLKEESLVNIFGGEKGASWFVFIIALVLVGSIIANFYGGKLLEMGSANNETNPQSQFQKNLVKSLFNESVLGVVLVLLVAFLAMRFISGT